MRPPLILFVRTQTALSLWAITVRGELLFRWILLPQHVIWRGVIEFTRQSGQSLGDLHIIFVLPLVTLQFLSLQVLKFRPPTVSNSFDVARELGFHFPASLAEFRIMFTFPRKPCSGPPRVGLFYVGGAEWKMAVLAVVEQREGIWKSFSADVGERVPGQQNPWIGLHSFQYRAKR